MTGHIPESFANLINLHFLGLTRNRLAGPIPAFLGNFTNLSDLSLGGNKFSGSIPGSLGNLTKLDTLNLTDNKLSGEIPFSLSNLTSLKILNLGSNQLSGRIPSFFGNFKNLVYLFLSYNQLSGRIPSSFGNLINLRYLDLSHNQLSDTIPLTLAKIAKNNLFVLHLEYNKFTFAGMGRLDSASMGVGLSYYPQAIIPLHKNGNTLSVSVGSIPYNNTYKWYKDGILFKTKMGDSTLQPTISGAYHVKVTNSVAMQLTLHSTTVFFTANNLIAEQASELNTENKISSIAVYPNPAKTNATLSFNADGKYAITIADVSGKVLQTKTGIAIKGSNIIQLDVSKYASGLYLVTLTDEKNKKQTLTLNKE